ncbi:hypothetical protein B0A55_10662 [Friedmanniomyces simplex]|uniref:Uncharacterized protein n=1 Tax=Friedmanniomyces simplex TaxID=329884 RepID=A0A4U0WU41_9PEZI|nr:hypothetical protein B0A55_10662 [Friedmanniomyces simplex]
MAAAAVAYPSIHTSVPDHEDAHGQGSAHNPFFDDEDQAHLQNTYTKPAADAGTNVGSEEKSVNHFHVDGSEDDDDDEYDEEDEKEERKRLLQEGVAGAPKP